MLKFVYAFNWLCIGLLALFVLALLLDPNKGGGDAATRGLGTAFLFLGLAALAVLLTLNLLPWPWTKYVAALLVLLPAFYFFAPRGWMLNGRSAQPLVDKSKPFFEDPGMERLARALYEGKPETMRQLLLTTPPEIVRAEPLMWHAIQESVDEIHLVNERLQCTQMLIDAGAPFDIVVKSPEYVLDRSTQYSNLAALRFLFEHGVDPNTRDPNSNLPIIFENITGSDSGDAMGCLKAFLDAGADVNASHVFETGDSPITLLIRAAYFKKWDMCIELITRGARIHEKSVNGKSCAYYMNEYAVEVANSANPQEKASFARLQELLKAPQ